MLKRVNKVWGFEEILVNNEKYCAKFLNLKKGYQCSMHYHRLKDETFYVLEGTVRLELEGSTFIMYEGEQKRVYPYNKHRFTSLTKTAKILEVSTTHYDSDSYRLKKSGKIKK